MFFDGAAANSMGGVGAVLYIGSDHYFFIQLGCGQSTNTRAKLLALWVLLFVADEMGLLELRVFGDSKTIID